MKSKTVLAALLLSALALTAAEAATGTLDTGALTPQATGSRTAEEIMNTGAAARTKGGEKPPAAQPMTAPLHPGIAAGPTGRERPPQ